MLLILCVAGSASRDAATRAPCIPGCGARGCSWLLRASRVDTLPNVRAFTAINRYSVCLLNSRLQGGAGLGSIPGLSGLASALGAAGAEGAGDEDVPELEGDFESASEK